MKVIFHIDGGLGKHIMSTAILKVIYKKFPESKIDVVCSYPDVFKHNPLVNSVSLNGQHGAFYETHIKDNKNEVKLFYTDPYTHSDFILEQDHLYNIWAKQWGLEYDGETPQIYLTESEIEYFKPFYKTPKPILAIQPNGGPPNLGYNYSWTRDIPEPIMLKIIEEFKNQYSIVHIKRDDQKTYPDTLHALDNFRSIAILLQLSSKRLLIDSFTQHLSAAYSLPSTVCWITTKPECYGYEMHDNILANEFTLPIHFPNNLYQPFNLAQDITSCPYKNLNEVFDVDKIINSIKK
mgnify:CR=1 FL=1